MKWYILLLVTMAACSVFGDAPTQRSATQPSLDPVEEYDQTAAEITRLRTTIENLRKGRIDRFTSSEKYRSLNAAVQSTLATLETARKSGTADERLVASRAYIGAKKQLADYEKQNVTSREETEGDALLRAKTQRLAELKPTTQPFREQQAAEQAKLDLADKVAAIFAAAKPISFRLLKVSGKEYAYTAVTVANARATKVFEDEPIQGEMVTRLSADWIESALGKNTLGKWVQCQGTDRSGNSMKVFFQRDKHADFVADSRRVGLLKGLVVPLQDESYGLFVTTIVTKPPATQPATAPSH